MSQIIVLTPEQLESMLQRTVADAIDACMNKVTALQPEGFLSKLAVMKMLNIGHSKVNQLLEDDKLIMHDNGKILKSSVDNYLKMC